MLQVGIRRKVSHLCGASTLSIYTDLFEDPFDSVMDRLDAANRDLVQPKSGPIVIEIPGRRPSQASDQGV